MFVLYPLGQGFVNWACTMIDKFNRHAFYHALNSYLPINQSVELRPQMYYDWARWPQNWDGTTCLPTWEP